jgi:tetratricopeptide (TPR) repeat protein
VSGDGETGIGREATDLEPAMQRAILDKERALSGDHFAVLGLGPDASPDEARDAYYALSRQFHPDRFFRKNLGPFEKKLERIFQRLSEAEQVLTDPARREAYLRANPQLRPAPPVVDPERAAERRDRMARHPYLQKPGRAREITAQAEKLLQGGQVLAAIEALKDAQKLDPRSAEITKLLADAQKRFGEMRQQHELGRGEDLEARGDHAAALKAYLAAVRTTPSASLHKKIAQAMLATGAPPQQVRPHAEQAVSMAPSNVEHRVLLAEVLLALGDKKAAKKELEIALEKDPSHARAAQLHKKTRGFF